MFLEISLHYSDELKISKQLRPFFQADISEDAKADGTDENVELEHFSKLSLAKKLLSHIET